jgi:glycosyltransferase involved in cell wall biosynthesis
MKILLLNSEYPPIGGGAGNATANLARHLALQGQDVKVVTVQFADLPKSEYREGFQIKRIPAIRKKADRSSASEQLSYILSATFYCFSLFRRWKPDIVWAFFGIPSGFIGILLKYIFHIPYIVSLRGGDVPGFRPYDFAFYHHLLGPIIKMVWRHSSAVVANSNGLKKLATSFYDQVPVINIPNGVDLDYFHDTKRDWGAPTMLFIGRVVYQKGLDLLMSALIKIKDIPWKLLIVGDGSYMDQLKSIVKDQGLNNRVQFFGWRNKEDLPSFLARATLFINPSRHEGMPNAVLEAMASGLPIVASDIAGNEELVKDGKNGYLFDNENCDDLREILAHLLTDSKLCKKMGATSRRITEKNYSWSSSGNQYLTLLKQIVEQ